MVMKIKKFNEQSNENNPNVINNKLELYKSTLSLFLTELPNDDIILTYLIEEDGHEDLIDYIGMHIKPEIGWSTSIGILDSCDIIIDESHGNTNINSDYSLK